MPTPLAEGQENSFAPQMIFLWPPVRGVGKKWFFFCLRPGGWANNNLSGVERESGDIHAPLTLWIWNSRILLMHQIIESNFFPDEFTSSIHYPTQCLNCSKLSAALKSRNCVNYITSHPSPISPQGAECVKSFSQGGLTFYHRVSCPVWKGYNLCWNCF